MKRTLLDTIFLNFARTTNEVRVTFTSRHDGTLNHRLDKLSGHHNDLQTCPLTLKNLLVVRELLDSAIESLDPEEKVS